MEFLVEGEQHCSTWETTFATPPKDNTEGLMMKLGTEYIKGRINWLHLLLCPLFILICIQVAEGNLKTVPRNTICSMNNVSSQTKVECFSDLGYRLKWYKQSNSSLERSELYNGYALNNEALSYCRVENGDPGNNTLKLTSIEEAAQTYTCFEPGTLDEASAELILIGETKCEINSVDSYINVTCSVPFRGNWAPVLEWKQNEDILKDNVTSSVVPNQEITSTILLPSSEFGASNYTCTTKFNIGGKPRQTTDDNVPSYADVLNISKVLFPTSDGSDSQGSSCMIIVIILMVIGVVVV